MAYAPRDQQLLEYVEALVRSCNNNQSEAARKMGVTRLQVNRLLQSGRARNATREKLWEGLTRATGVKAPQRGIHTARSKHSVSEIALQVIQYINAAVEDRSRREGDTK